MGWSKRAGPSGCWPPSWPPASGWRCPPARSGDTCTPAAGAGRGPAWTWPPTPGQNVKRTIFGALDARTGALHQLIRPRKRAVDFIAFLDHLAQAYPTGEVVLVLDNVITHDAKLL